jgi:hypothetical protein
VGGTRSSSLESSRNLRPGVVVIVVVGLDEEIALAAEAEVQNVFAVVDAVVRKACNRSRHSRFI